MCVPVCGWCLAWGHFSCFTSGIQCLENHTIFKKWFSHAADTGFLSCAELLTLSSSWLRTRKHRFLVAQRGLSWLKLMYIHRKTTHTNKFCCKITVFCSVLFFTIQLTHVFVCTLQVLSLCPKATLWVFPSRKSPCSAWYQTPQRCSAPCRAASPCWAPLPSTRLPWPRSRDACHLQSASTRRSWEEFYAGQSSHSFNLTAGSTYWCFSPVVVCKRL